MVELSDNAYEIAKSRYFWEEETKWEQLSERICKETSKNERSNQEKHCDDFISIIDPMYFIPAGRILRNVGKLKPATSNCNVLPIEDSIESILETLKYYGVVSAYGGGNGINFSNLRPKGTPLQTRGGKSSGMISFIEMFDEVGKRLETGGARRSAGMAMCSVYHPEVLDFIDAKIEHNKLTQFNISVAIDSTFLRAVENNEDWELKFAGKVYTTVKARNIWDRILQNMIDHAEPGLVNWDNLRKNNTYYFSPIVCTNPCQPKWATVLTPRGISTLGALQVGDSIWSENGWTQVTNIHYSGVKEVYKYKTTAGSFYGTKNHKILSNGEKIKVDEAETIDSLRGSITNNEEFIDNIVIDGLVIGDGSVHKASNNLVYLIIGENDKDYFDSEISHLLLKNRDKLKKGAFEVATSINYKELPKTYYRYVPNRFKFSTPIIVKSFLRGLFTANGTVLEKYSRVSLRASSYRIVEDVQEMLSSVGISSYITKNISKTTKFSNGIYACKNSYDVNISTDIHLFDKHIGFLQKYKVESLQKAIKKRKYIGRSKTSFEIIEKEYISTEDVYDITVSGYSHTYWSGGLNVSNCGEQPLGEFDTCNLGSLVLPKFVTNVNTDWKKLEDVIYKSIRFMDNIIDLSFFPIPKQEEIAKNARRIGLGTMGLADYLFMKKIRYGSDKCINEIEKLYKFIRDTSYLASVELAKEKGAFPKYNKIDYMRASFIKKLPAKIRMEIREHSIRNSCLITQAPTGTTSLLADVVGGIEPLPFKGYRRKDRVSERIYIHPLAIENVKEDWFVDSLDLKPEEHLEVQATIQKYTDSGVSKTIILPEKTTVKDLDKYLMEYLSDLKGVTVYRDNSREKQVYYRLTDAEIKKYTKEAKKTLNEEDVQCKTGMCEI